MGQRKAFVAGATGYTGRALVPALVRAGFDVVAHVRPGSVSGDALVPGFEKVGAAVDRTAWEADALGAALRDHAPTHVFGLLGTTKKRARTEGLAASDAYEQVDFGLTAMLIDATVGSSAEARFVYLSAAGLSEATSNPYMRARVRIEAKLRDGPLRWTVVRPSFITGDREESRPAEAAGAVVADALLSVGGFFGAKKLRDRYQSLTGTQLAEGIVRIVAQPGADQVVVHADQLR